MGPLAHGGDDSASPQLPVIVRVPRSHPLTGAAALAGLPAALAAQVAAADWSFFVQNSSSSRITRLEVREKGGPWGQFDLGSGIGPGEKVRLDGDKSTDNQDCRQTLRAFFADGSSSDPSVFAFCDDLNTPIVCSD